MSTEPVNESCGRARELASAWVDGELRGERDGELRGERDLRRHLAECRACCAFVDELRAISAELAPLVEAPAPERWSSIAARVQQTAKRRKHEPLLRAAAALIGAVGAWFALSAVERALDRRHGLVQSLTQVAALEAPPSDLQHVLAAPEHQLLLAIASQTETHR